MAAQLKFDDPEPWRVWDDESSMTPAESMERDGQLLSDIQRELQPSTCRIWASNACIAATRLEASKPGFAIAAAELSRQGWPVVVRGTGGTAVPLTPGILNLSMIYSVDAASKHSIQSAYEKLCAPLRKTLLDFGIDARYGPVDGCFCDGRYNLVVNGRKIAGTAQKWSASAGCRRVIAAQAMLIVERTGLESGVDAINRLYDRLALPERVDASTCVSIDACAISPSGDSRMPLMQQVRKLLAATLASTAGCVGGCQS